MTTSKTYNYYENGIHEIFTTEQTKELFETMVDDNQKAQGTTYETWLDEMVRMQILIPNN